MLLRTLFFDLDDTLYDSSCGLWDAIRLRMGQYMVERLGIPAAEANRLRQEYFTAYGTTLRGLQHHQQVDVDEYLAYVHDLPLPEFIQPDPDLRHMLNSLSQRKFIFTNADREHARRVLNTLQLEDCFEAVIDVRATGFHCKPDPQTYHLAMQLSGETQPGSCLLVDDSKRNLAPARQMGFTTVLVGSLQPDPAASVSILRLTQLPEALPELWNGRLA
jgi:putative hydrolase of the HAD superfamily